MRHLFTFKAEDVPDPMFPTRLVSAMGPRSDEIEPLVAYSLNAMHEWLLVYRTRGGEERWAGFQVWPFLEESRAVMHGYVNTELERLTAVWAYYTPAKSFNEVAQSIGMRMFVRRH